MSSPLPSALTDRLASSASGWGAVIDGVLDIRTVTHSRKAAALNALCVGNFRVIGDCADPDCNCTKKALAVAMPGARIVEVRVVRTT